MGGAMNFGRLGLGPIYAFWAEAQRLRDCVLEGASGPHQGNFIAPEKGLFLGRSASSSPHCHCRATAGFCTVLHGFSACVDVIVFVIAGIRGAVQGFPKWRSATPTAENSRGRPVAQTLVIFQAEGVLTPQ